MDIYCQCPWFTSHQTSINCPYRRSCPVTAGEAVQMYRNKIHQMVMASGHMEEVLVGHIWSCFNQLQCVGFKPFKYVILHWLRIYFRMRHGWGFPSKQHSSIVCIAVSLPVKKYTVKVTRIIRGLLFFITLGGFISSDNLLVYRQT